MNPTKPTWVVLMAASAFLWTGAAAAVDSHQHGTTANSVPDQTMPAPAVQPAPAVSAQDMMKAMENMPAHDHDTCCKLAGSKTKPKEHDH